MCVGRGGVNWVDEGNVGGEREEGREDRRETGGEVLREGRSGEGSVPGCATKRSVEKGENRGGSGEEGSATVEEGSV